MSIGGVSVGADAASRQPPPPAPAAAPLAPAAPAAAAAARGPGAAVLRSGRRWILRLTLPDRARVGAVVQRRRPAAGRRAPRFATVRGVRPRTLAAGTRRMALGTLAAGPHRVRVTVRSSRATVVLVRAFVVPRRAARAR
jgi:hypothetical protein